MRLEILQNGEVIETKEFLDGSFKIGRLKECDIFLPSSRVSKQHAVLIIRGNQIVIVDMGSSNGVFVNGILIKKQRVQYGDEVQIGEYRIRPIRPGEKRVGIRKNAGNTALKNEEMVEPAQAVAAPVQNQQEKFVSFIDQKVLIPFYSVMRNVDWRMLLLTILAIALLASSLLSIFPIVRWGKDITTQESLERAHTVLAQTVRENFRVLSRSTDYTKLTTEAAESETGILSVMIVDPKNNTILAPTKLLNKEIEDAYTLLAIKKVMEKKEEKVSIEKRFNRYIVAEPISTFSTEENDRVLQAIVIADFEIPSRVYSTFTPMAEACLFAILCSLLAYYFIFKMFTHPISQLQEQLDAALKGEDVTIESAARLPELEGLATTITFTVGRLRQLTGGRSMAGSGGADGEAEDAAYLKSLEEWDVIVSEAIVVLDKDKRVKFVGKILEDLIGLRNQYAANQNISDACKDASFAGTAIDLCDRVFQSLGEIQESNLEINGIPRVVFAVPHRNSGGEIKFVLIAVKMGGET